MAKSRCFHGAEFRSIRSSWREFLGHLFENPLTDVPRDVYWAVEIDFNAIRYLNEDWEISAGIEWLQFEKPGAPIENAVKASTVGQPNGEASFYLTEHWPCDNWSIEMRLMAGQPKWNLEFDLLVEFTGLGDDPVQDLQVKGATAVDFGRIIVVRDNLSPKPNTEQDAAFLVAEYIELDDSYACKDDGWRYVFCKR